MKYLVTLDQRQFDTTLAALRHYSGDPFWMGVSADIAANTHNQPLSHDEIGDLCDYLNPDDPEQHYIAVAPDVVLPVPLSDR